MIGKDRGISSSYLALKLIDIDIILIEVLSIKHNIKLIEMVEVSLICLTLIPSNQFFRIKLELLQYLHHLFLLPLLSHLLLPS